MLVRGFKIVFRSPRLLLLGALPALITGFALLAAVVALVVWAPGVITWATPFADSWDPTLREFLRAGIGISLVVGLVAVGLLLFAAITLAIGAPFYERITRHVEKQLGEVTANTSVSWWQSAGDNTVVVGTSLLVTVLLFLIDLIPVAGEIVGLITGICVNAWLFGLELSAMPLSRHGLTLHERRELLKKRRAMAIGFTLPTYLLCLVPLVAIIVMPAAAAGSTLLAHRLLTEGKLRRT